MPFILHIPIVIPLFIYLFIHLFIYSFIYLFIHLFTYSLFTVDKFTNKNIGYCTLRKMAVLIIIKNMVI